MAALNLLLVFEFDSTNWNSEKKEEEAAEEILLWYMELKASLHIQRYMHWMKYTANLAFCYHPQEWVDSLRSGTEITAQITWLGKHIKLMLV